MSRELDTEVAKEIMGMVPCSKWSPVSLGVAGGANMWKSEGDCTHGENGCYADNFWGNKEVTLCPKYSTSMEAAWSIVKKMIELGFKEWLVSDDEIYFQRGNLNDRTGEESPDYAFGAIGNIFDKTAENICKVALLAIKRSKAKQ